VSAEKNSPAAGAPLNPAVGLTGSPLRTRIIEEIRQCGPIPFSRYMEMCLYQPELGYYARPREQFGKAGDFYTSSDVHAVFGRLLARQFEEMWRALGAPERIELIELGPGRGLFASDVLDWSAKQFPEFARALRYVLVEHSEHLRARLHERLAEHIALGKARVCNSLDEVGSNDDPFILFANEFFDALPLEIVDRRGAVRVAEEQGRFVEEFAPASSEELAYIDRYSVHPEEGERVEVSLAALHWIDRIAELFRNRTGFAMFIDYGYTREEQLAGRHRDTLMTYHRHRANSSPYEAPGEQDITAHVNFTALRLHAMEAGLNEIALLTQTQLLLGIGEETQFADAFQDCKLPQERAKVALQLRHLLSPEEMGEKFQVLMLSHGVPADKTRQLSATKLLAR
jgi:SAM-dependent MidA family methyltransferase